MKKAIIILIILVFSLLYYGGAFSGRETLPFSREFFSVESSSSGDGFFEPRGILPPRARSEDPGASSLSTTYLDQLYQRELDKGIRNCPVLSLFLMRESERTRRKGNTDQAVEIATYAVKVSPDLSEPYFELARALWHQNPFQVHRILPEVLRGQFAQIRYFPSSLRFFYDLFFIFANAVLMTSILFGIVVMAKYLSLYFYDIRKGMNREVPRLLSDGLKIVLLFVPFFLGLDLLWAVLFWTILLWGFVTKRERQLILLFLILLVYFPFFLRSSSAFLDGASSDIILGMSRANHADSNPSIQRELEAWATANPNDAEVLFTLALIEKRQGHYSEAEELYRRAIQERHQFSEAYSNLGNVFLAEKQADLAINSYQQAVALDPNRASYHFNLHRAYSQETFLSGKSEKAFQSARLLDPKLIDHYLKSGASSMNRIVIDEVLTAKRLWKRFLSQFLGSEGFLFSLFRAWFEPIPSRIPFLIPVLFLGFLIGISKLSRAKRFLTRCPMCGSPTHRFYLGSSDQEFICFNCHRIFIQKEKLHPKIAGKKTAQARQHQKQSRDLSRFLALFFPGFGNVWGMYPFKGLLFIFVFFIFVLRFAYWEGAIAPSLPRSSFPILEILFWGGLFVLFYAYAFRQIDRERPEVKKAKQVPGRPVSSPEATGSMLQGNSGMGTE
jgi:tetratricopeptide (TPR) repeat protein